MLGAGSPFCPFPSQDILKMTVREGCPKGGEGAVVYRSDVVFFIAAGGRDASTTTRGGA